ncbi:MAG: S1C family serine protease [Acidobacteria bacterium]|nr:S1C family serine protease [Acidobacteriota bacterium]
MSAAKKTVSMNLGCPALQDAERSTGKRLTGHTASYGDATTEDVARAMLMKNRVPFKPSERKEVVIPTANSLQRTYLVRDKLIGTAFTIDRDGRQYLVTARHVSEGASGVIGVFHDGEWKRLDVAVAGVGRSEDVAVLCADRQLSPTYSLVASDDGLSLGQQVRFLGFPFGWQHKDHGLNNGYPLPFAKSGIVSVLGDDDMTRV